MDVLLIWILKKSLKSFVFVWTIKRGTTKALITVQSVDLILLQQHQKYLQQPDYLNLHHHHHHHNTSPQLQYIQTEGHEDHDRRTPQPQLNFTKVHLYHYRTSTSQQCTVVNAREHYNIYHYATWLLYNTIVHKQIYHSHSTPLPQHSVTTTHSAPPPPHINSKTSTLHVLSPKNTVKHWLQHHKYCQIPPQLLSNTIKSTKIQHNQ